MNKLKLINRVLLGLLMFIPGITKLIATLNGQEYVSRMVSGIFLFAWAPIFWAWILILSEVLFGLAIIFNYKIKYSSIPPAFILSIALIFVTIKWNALGSTSWSGVLFHLIAIVGYISLFYEKK